MGIMGRPGAHLRLALLEIVPQRGGQPFATPVRLGWLRRYATFRMCFLIHNNETP